MNKKNVEKKHRTSKKNNSLSAFSETQNDTNTKKELNDIITFITPFKCKTKKQKELIALINEKEIVIAAGPSGVGKSYVTIARALELLKNLSSPYNKLIISKPAIEADEQHGFLPGTMREKMDPFIGSSIDIVDKIIGKSNRLYMEELGYIEIQPLAYIRGKSIDNTILIMEEAQNMSPRQMKTLLTRIGNCSKFIISGDLDQSDRYKNLTQSGLYDALNRHKNVEEIGFLEFSEDEIVRNPIINKILNNYKSEKFKYKLESYNPIVKKTKRKSLKNFIFNLFK